MGKKKVSIQDRIPAAEPAAAPAAKAPKKSSKSKPKSTPQQAEPEPADEDTEMKDAESEEEKDKDESSDEEEEEEGGSTVKTEYDAYTEEEKKLLSMDEDAMEDTTFAELDLDSRLLQALSLIKLYKPTPIQVKAIPLALGLKKDIIGRAKTGSGKTVAYAIPIVESILQESVKSQQENTNNSSSTSSNKNSIGNRAIILVPSRELADQVTKLFKSLTIFADKLVGVVNVSSQQSSSSSATTSSENIMTSLLATKPAVIVGTPAKVLTHIQSGSINASAISYLVIDEADLILSYGFREDLDALAELLPVKKTIQTWLMSATISEDIDDIKAAFCRKNLAVLRLEDDAGSAPGAASSNKLLQYYVKTAEIDKFLLTYVIFKLKLIRGKTLIFVNNTERCYQLKLFLEQFGIKSIVLNSELPIASRLHIVEEFNRNVYDLLIATDENTHYVAEGDEDKEEEAEEEKNKADEPEAKKKKRRQNKKSKFSSDKEYSVSRGVDFRNVACVLNFDLPTSSTVYTHRIGRTARANKSGMALSFVVPRKEWRKKENRQASLDTAKKDEKILARVMRHQEKKRARALRRLGVDEELLNSTAEQQQASAAMPEGFSETDPAVLIQPYVFDMVQMESFRYRMEGAFRAVTKMAIREARIKEIRQELLTSEKLKRHFEENPEDLAFLRHDKELHAAKVQPHLKRVPQYLLPAQARTSLNTLQPHQQYVSARKSNTNRIKKQQAQKKRNQNRKGGDPLKSFRR